MTRPIRKLLVANRGEIAQRVFSTCNQLGIATVAVYSEADRRAPHRFGADEAVRIGGPTATESYLRGDAIVDVARSLGVDAIHPGYGFLSENAEFARKVQEAGITFVGPSPQNIRDMGDKVRARELMAAAGVPVVPGYDGPVTDPAEAARAAKAVGYPLLVKAAGGGGGKGIRHVNRPEELANAILRATSEAGAAFGDARVYFERLVSPARHIEAQIFGDGKGGAIFLGERECSLQRNHQKLVEESPSPVLDDEIRGQLREAALAGTRAIQYSGAGTFEFLYDEVRREFYFLEMNTRLQVEHPVTEMVTRWDLVAEQLRIAEGGTLDGVAEPARQGHSIELRVYAEDPYRGFAPSTGTIEALRLPHGPFTRIDHALRDRYEVTPYYDPMLAKLIVWGADRPQAISRLQALIRKTRIGGIHTSLPLGMDICRWPDFQAGDFHTGSLEAWLEGRASDSTTPPSILVQLAGLVARDALSSTASRRKRRPGHHGGAWGSLARQEAVGRRPG